MIKPKTKIRLPLNAEFERAFTSATYHKSMEHGLGQLDLLYTYLFRYPRLFSVDIFKQKNNQILKRIKIQ